MQGPPRFDSLKQMDERLESHADLNKRAACSTPSPNGKSTDGRHDSPFASGSAKGSSHPGGELSTPKASRIQKLNMEVTVEACSTDVNDPYCLAPESDSEDSSPLAPKTRIQSLLSYCKPVAKEVYEKDFAAAVARLGEDRERNRRLSSNVKKTKD